MASILLVDDEPDLLTVLAILLDIEGYEVLTAADGAAALDLVAARPVDLVVADLMMPNMDGVELCRRLRSNPATRHIPIVLNSAGAQEPPGAGVLFDVFMAKPQRFEDQLRIIRQLLQPQPRTAAF